jgi:hypothetical protein
MHITQEITNTDKYGHNLELYNSKPSVASSIFYNKLPNRNQKPVCEGIEEVTY